MPDTQLYLEGMEPPPQPARKKAPGESLRKTVAELQERVFALEVDATVEKVLNEEARRKP